MDLLGFIIAPLGRYAIRGLILLAGILAGLCAQTARAQTNPCTTGRLPTPFPTLAEEIRDMNAGQPVLGFVVGDLRLEGNVHDRPAVRARILKSLRKCFFENESDLLTFGADVEIKGYFQDHGYLEAKVDVEPKPLDIKNKLQRILIIARVQESDQFRLKQLTFEQEGEGFGPKDSFFRKEFPLRRGNLVNVGKLREGILDITRLYSTFGYIDTTVEPQTDMDHSARLISINLVIYSGKQYSVAKVEVLGLKPEIEEDLRKIVSPGEIYNQNLIDAAFKLSKPAQSSCNQLLDVFEIHRDEQKQTVNVVFDFRKCQTQTN